MELKLKSDALFRKTVISQNMQKYLLTLTVFIFLSINYYTFMELTLNIFWEITHLKPGFQSFV